MSGCVGSSMKVGSLVTWKYNPYIGIVIENDDGFVTVHWLDDGYVSWEDSCDLREVIDESR